MVDLRDGPLARVEVLLELLQVCEGVVVVEQPGDAVDHHHAAGIDLYLVARAGDDAGRAGRDAFHDDDLVAGQALDGVVDGDAGVEVAAAAIDLDGDVALALDGREILHEALGRDVEAGLACPQSEARRRAGECYAFSCLSPSLMLLMASAMIASRRAAEIVPLAAVLWSTCPCAARSFSFSRVSWSTLASH